MSNIMIYSDLNNNYQGQYDILIKRIDDYVDGYATIKRSINDSKKLVIVVQNRYCLNYLQGMLYQYGRQYIEIQESSPRKKLGEVLKVQIPDNITDEEIVVDQIIYNIDQLHHTAGMSFDDIILYNYMSPYFTYDKFPFFKIIDFIQSLDYEKFKMRLEQKITRKVYKNKLDNWMKLSEEQYEKNIIKAFTKDPKQLLNDLSKYSIIREYPNELQMDVLGDNSKNFQKLKLSVQPFLIEGLNTIELQRNIKVYLNQLDTKSLSKELIKKYVTMVSGLLHEELDFILDVIANSGSAIDKKTVEKIADKFNSVLIEQPQYNEKIKNLIPPPVPKEPERAFTAEQWLDWAVKEYLPYKFWLEDNDTYNERIDEYAFRYGNWIYKNYHQLLASESSMLFKTLINLNKNLSSDEASLIVMVDNYNFKYVPLAKGYFNEYGFNTTMEKPLISMLPTETAVSKAAFFSGEPYGSKNKSYEKRCKEWETHFNKKVKYLSDVSKLDEIDEKKADIYILNYISIDRILHESQNHSALSINYRVQEELKAMINKVIHFAKRIGYENEMKIYFTSDHGSTKIFPDQHNLIDSKYYKEKAEDAAHRYISLKDKQFKSYKDSIGELCYVMDKHHYGTEENYLIAKKYYRFIKTDGSFYVHGGITPEENIVPLLKFEKTVAKLIEPNLILRTTEFRYSILSSVIVTLKNYNEYDLKNIEISFLNQNINWDEKICKIETIKQQNEETTELQGIRIKKSQGDRNKMMIKLKYDFLGKAYQKDYSFDIDMKSIQENKIDLDDMF